MVCRNKKSVAEKITATRQRQEPKVRRVKREGYEARTKAGEGRRIGKCKK